MESHPVSDCAPIGRSRLRESERSRWRKTILRLEPLENRSLPSTASYTASVSDFTNFTDEPLSQSTPPPVVPIPQFDTQGGTRTLESVELRSHIDVDSTVS